MMANVSRLPLEVTDQPALEEDGGRLSEGIENFAFEVDDQEGKSNETVSASNVSKSVNTSPVPRRDVQAYATLQGHERQSATRNNNLDSRPSMNPRHRRPNHPANHDSHNNRGTGFKNQFHVKVNSWPVHPMPATNVGVGNEYNRPPHDHAAHGNHNSVSQGASPSAVASDLVGSSTLDTSNSGVGAGHTPAGGSRGRLRCERASLTVDPSPPPLPALLPSHRTGNARVTTTNISTVMSQVENNILNPERLPDLLNSHFRPPPYSTWPHNRDSTHVHASTSAGPVPCGMLPNLPVLPFLPYRRSWGDRLRSPVPSGRQRSRSRRRSVLWGSHYTPEDEPKHCCCGVAVTQSVSIRWFIVMIAFVGLCCAVVGTVLGALKATGREHLTVSLLLIGVGITLITVSAMTWRLTSDDAPSCRMMLGLSSAEPEPTRRFVPRVSPSYGRPHHPYAAMMYPEFQQRPPPPSYQASMQEYRLRLLLLDRHPPSTSTSISSSSVSPPPLYRSNVDTGILTRPPIRDRNDYSRPPSYRSQASSVNLCPSNNDNNGTLRGSQTTRGTLWSTHSRDPSLTPSSLLSHEILDRVVPSTEQCGWRSGSGPKLPSTTAVVSTPLAAPSSSSSSAEQDLTTTSLPGRRTLDRRPDVHATVEEGPLEHGPPESREWDPVRQTVASTIKRPCDCNVVRIVQTRDASQVVASGGNSCSEKGSVDHTPMSGNELVQQQRASRGEMEVLAHL